MTSNVSLGPPGPSGFYPPPMPHAVADVAGELRLRLPGLRVFRLHKLLYFCQGYHIAHFGSQLFDETVSAWDHGPVVGRLWHAENVLVQSPGAREIEDEGALNTIGFIASHFGHLSSRARGPDTRARAVAACRPRPTYRRPVHDPTGVAARLFSSSTRAGRRRWVGELQPARPPASDSAGRVRRRGPGNA